MWVYTDKEIANLNILSGVTFTITKTGILKVTGDITVNGTLVIIADGDGTGVLIPDSNGFGCTFSGNVTYKRFFNSGYHQICSPVVGMDIGYFCTTNSNILYNEGSYGLFRYAEQTWEQYNTSNVIEAGDFEFGKGYLINIARAGGGEVVFVGTIPTSDQTITIHSGWSFIGNPFMSYLSVNQGIDSFFYGQLTGT